MKTIKLLIIIPVLLCSQFARAGLISDYTLDESTNIVTDSVNQLEWLQWDETLGMSISDYLNGNGNSLIQDGWQLATNAQVAGVLNTFFSSVTWGDDENDSQIYHLAGGPSAVDNEVDILHSYFGFYVSEDTQSSYSTVIQALYGSDLDNDENYKLFFASQQDYLDLGLSTGGVQMYGDDPYFSQDLSIVSTGLALVRKANAISVPEPSTMVLTLIGLIWLRTRSVASQA